MHEKNLLETVLSESNDAQIEAPKKIPILETSLKKEEILLSPLCLHTTVCRPGTHDYASRDGMHNSLPRRRSYVPTTYLLPTPTAACRQCTMIIFSLIPILYPLLLPPPSKVAPDAGQSQSVSCPSLAPR